MSQTERIQLSEPRFQLAPPVDYARRCFAGGELAYESEDSWPNHLGVWDEAKPLTPTEPPEKYCLSASRVAYLECHLQESNLVPTVEWGEIQKIFTRKALVDFYFEYDLVTLDQRFKELATKWYQETGATSSITKKTSNINYLKIIALGKPVVPLILNELRRIPAPWFLALGVLTGEMEIGKEFPGDFKKIAAAWVRWGVLNSYI